jgi:type I restriction-modification system DNA methylase subunit
MSEMLWQKVQERINDHSYMAGVSRTVERVKATGEIFTPTELVMNMLKSTPLNSFAPGRRVLDPACGDGQFLVGAKWTKVFFFDVSENQALQDIYGIDIMRDNVDLCKSRLRGGFIVMGDALRPTLRLEGQLESEHEFMISHFDYQDQLTLF